jgi:hypothetical protein
MHRGAPCGWSAQAGVKLILDGWPFVAEWNLAVVSAKVGLRAGFGHFPGKPILGQSNLGASLAARLLWARRAETQIAEVRSGLIFTIRN